MNGFSTEADARLEYVRRIRHALEQRFIEDGVSEQEIEEERQALTATAQFILDSTRYQAQQQEDGSWILLFTR